MNRYINSQQREHFFVNSTQMKTGLINSRNGKNNHYSYFYFTLAHCYSLEHSLRLRSSCPCWATWQLLHLYTLYNIHLQMHHKLLPDLTSRQCSAAITVIDENSPQHQRDNECQKNVACINQAVLYCAPLFLQTASVHNIIVYMCTSKK